MTAPMYIAGVMIFLVVVAFALVFELRKSERKEKEIPKRLDKDLATKDDPGEPARWVR